MRRRRLTFLALAAATALAAGCGGDDEEPGGGGGSGEAGGGTLDLRVSSAGEGSFALDAPQSIPGGVVEVTLANAAQEPHEAQLVRVEGEHTEQEVLDALGAASQGEAFPPWFIPAGGPYTTPPGQSSSVTLDLEPGTYWVLDGQSPEGTEGGESYAAQGSLARVSVEDGDEAAELPDTDATIEMVDYDFEPTGLTAGTNRITMMNSGEEIHHTIAFPIRGDASIEEVEEVFAAPPGEAPPGGGPPPLDFEGELGTTVLDGGRSQIVEFDLEPGRYALVCFVSDREGGPPHVAKGMIREVQVR